jgi:DNA-binding transcriptional MerR regulator
MFRIGEFARLGGVSAKMLRAYDSLGLFRPVWVDPASGYRYYSPAQLPELRRIVALRHMGVPLAEVAGHVAGGEELRALLERRRRELEREQQALERRLQALDITVESAGGGAPGPDVVLRPVAAELVATLAVDPASGDLGAAFYELETYVRDLGRRAPRPPGAIIGPLPGAAPGERPLAEVFVPLRGSLVASDRVAVRRLPAVRAASVIHRGSYGGHGSARAALERWVAAAGFAPADRLRVLYLQFGAEPELRVPRGLLVERDDDLVTELQLPVGDA